MRSAGVVMGRSGALSILNGKILATYSSRTVLALPQGLPVRLLLARLKPVLALNVEKEARKDALVIARAALAPRAEATPDPGALQQLVEATKAIDGEFVQRVRHLPVRLAIRYDDIAPVRVRRIERLYGAARRILHAWDVECRLRSAVRLSFAEPELERLLYDLLQLYALEVRLLSRSVALPALVTPLRDQLAQSLFSVMNDVAARLARELATAIHRTAPSSVRYRPGEAP